MISVYVILSRSATNSQIKNVQKESIILILAFGAYFSLHAVYVEITVLALIQ